MYFADDDNTYDYRLFREISRTNRISMFPVGFIGGQGVSAPIVKEGEVIGFTDDWFAQRKWPVDMAGFAIRISFLKSRLGVYYLLFPIYNFFISLSLSLSLLSLF